jgi:hypothetical protein
MEHGSRISFTSVFLWGLYAPRLYSSSEFPSLYSNRGCLLGRDYH